MCVNSIRTILRSSVSPLLNILKNSRWIDRALIAYQYKLSCKNCIHLSDLMRNIRLHAESGDSLRYLTMPEPFYPIPNKYPPWRSAEDALRVVTSGKFCENKILLHY